MKEGRVSVHDRESNLYQQQLEQYISTYLAQGYTPEQLKEYLISKGYDEQSVISALSNVNKAAYNGELEVHKPSRSMHTLFLLLFFVVLISLGAFLYFNQPAPYEFSMTLENNELSLGDNIELYIQTTKTIELKTNIVTQGGEFILEQTDIVDSSSNYIVDLPKNIVAGSYVIDVDVIYKDEIQDKSFPFIIKEEREVVSQPQAPLVPNLNVAKKSASEQFSRAIDSLDSLNCKSISIDPIRDECYFVIARDTKDETICALIEDIPKQERCYLTQVMGGNTITCTILSEPQNIAICENIS